MRRPPSSRRRLVGLALVAALAGLVLKASDPMETDSRRTETTPAARGAARPVVPGSRDGGPVDDDASRCVAPPAGEIDAFDADPSPAVDEERWDPASPPPATHDSFPPMMPAVARPRPVAANVPRDATVVRPARQASEKPLRKPHRRPNRNHGEAVAPGFAGAPVDDHARPPGVTAPPVMATPGPVVPAAGTAPPTAIAAAPTPTATAPAGDVAFQSGDGVQFPTDGQVALPLDGKLGDQGGSVSLWVQPGWQPGSDDGATLVQLGDGLRVTKDGDSLRLEAATGGSPDAGPTDAGSPEADGTADVDTSIGHWNPGEWHRVVATWTDDHVSLYVDGELVGRGHGRGPVGFSPEGDLRVGSDPGEHDHVSPGLIGGVDVRTRALDDDEIAREYRNAIQANPPSDDRDDRDRRSDRGRPR